METSIQQQIFEQLTKAKKVLVALPKNSTADTVSSGLAVQLFLKKMGKETDVVSAGVIGEQLLFLPGALQIKPVLDGAKSLVISVDTSVKELEEISYQNSAQKVSIYLKAKNGFYDSSDIHFNAEMPSYDVIITLGARSLEDLGATFEQNADMLFEAPKINIDNHAANDYFGAINLVDINATSIAEILSVLLASHESHLIDEDIATCLLTGIIGQTHSFQHVQTTPSAFLRASELISLGGRQQEVVKNLFKTKSLPLLRLWGRALARLKTDDRLSSVYSLLNSSDFEKAGASNSELMPVLSELMENMDGYKIVAIISEFNNGVRIISAIHIQYAAEIFIKSLGAKAPTQSSAGSYVIVDIFLPGAILLDVEQKFLAACEDATQVPVTAII